MILGDARWKKIFASVSRAAEQPQTEAGRLLEEMAQAAFNKRMDELTYEELFKIQQALLEQVQPQPYEIK